MLGTITGSYTFSMGQWQPPAAVTPTNLDGDAIHASMITRADELQGSGEGSPEECELEALSNAIEAYEAVRWPLGKIPGGKG